MKFPIDVYDHEIVSLLQRLLAITGEGPWLKKFGTLHQQFKENEFLRDWMIERHGVELKFAELLGRQAREARCPANPNTPARMKATQDPSAARSDHEPMPATITSGPKM